MHEAMSLEEGLAAGVVITAEQADTVIEALSILRNHAEGIRNLANPGAHEASETIAQKLIPVGELLLMMFESGMVAPRSMAYDLAAIEDLLTPDPWGQAEQRSDYMMSDEAYDVRGFGDDYGED